MLRKMIVDAEFFTAGGANGIAIICLPTGIICTVQAGGISCRHPEIEGFPFPIFFKGDYDFDCLHGCWGGEKIADNVDRRNVYIREIEKFLIENVNTMNKYSFHFDHNREDALMEGWWPVLISLGNDISWQPGEEANPKVENKFKGYLYFGNCD